MDSQISLGCSTEFMNSSVDLHNLAEKNCKFRIVSIRHLPDLRYELEHRQKRGEVSSQITNEYLFRFRFALPDELPDAQSLIIVAASMPLTKATFNWKGNRRTFILPPTYTDEDGKRHWIERTLADAVGKKGYRTAAAKLPLKLLAARSGLAFYGRNNIAYVSGMGSFLGLTAVYSDVPCEQDSWQEPQLMKRCETCSSLCQKSCPTGAIAGDRFLLRAERCLTYHNERAGSIPFPKWIDPSWHNSIIGCMCCQAVCPENTPFLKQFGKAAEFDEEETELLLNGTKLESIPALTMSKMKMLSLTDYLNELPRNLFALLK
jgi:epoxyqueuosine reductase